MITKTFSRAEIKQRFSLKRNHLPAQSGYSDLQSVSLDWLARLDAGLDRAKNKVQKVHTAFLDAMRNNTDLEQVKWELARIPIPFLLKYSHQYYPDIKEEIEGMVAQNDKHSFIVGSQDCPKNVFPNDISDLDQYVKLGIPVWCYYPVTLAHEKGIEIVKTWTEEDSFVDWLTDFLKPEDTEAAIQIDNHQDTENTSYTLYLPSETNTDKLDTGQQDLASIEQIYHFICQHAPVRTQEILEQNFAQRMQVFRHLKKLDRENRIEKVKHGVYIPT